jgi:hypothetical protein
MSLKKENPQLYSQIHYWAYKNIQKPSICVRCNLVKPLEISNNSGLYTPHITDWEWICKSCHAKKDKWGDLEKAHKARRGRPSWNRGLKASDETRKKLSESHKGKVHAGTFKKGQTPWTKGRKLSEEHKRKIGEANKISVKNYYNSR